MENIQAHPNTQAVLHAWRRLSAGEAAIEQPATEDDPALIGRLFVLGHIADGDYSFRRAGCALERLFGRDLVEHNFLSIWNEADRDLVSAALFSAGSAHGPVIIRARGETLVGKRVELEFAVAPLRGETGLRFLGICQTVTPEDVLGRRPLRRLQAIAVYPPAPKEQPAIRVVSSDPVRKGL